MACRFVPQFALPVDIRLGKQMQSDAQLLFERRGGFRRGCRKLRYAGQVLPGSPLYPVGAGVFGAGCNMVFRRSLLGGPDLSTTY